MPVWSWFFIAAAVLIAIMLGLVAVLSVVGRKKTERLQRRFGPEYDRVVSKAGDQVVGEQQLSAREHEQ